MKRLVRRLETCLARYLMGRINRRAWRRQRFKRINERPLEYAFAFECLAQACPRTVLDVGPGNTAWPSLLARCGFVVTAIDEIKGFWPGGFFNPHFHVIHDDITRPALQQEFDFITCISTLEHIPDHRAAMRGMFRLLRPGGQLVLTCPYNEHRYVPDAYRLPGAGYGHEATFVCQVFSAAEVDGWLKENPGVIKAQAFYEAFTGELWTLGERLYPPRKVARADKHHLTALCVQKE